MAKNSIDAYGASGKTNVLMFDPENLHLVTDKTHPLYDERIHLPIDEGMVLNIKELGVLEPIIVWKDPETGLTCVVVGRQRVRHTDLIHRWAGLKKCQTRWIAASMRTTLQCCLAVAFKLSVQRFPCSMLPRP